MAQCAKALGHLLPLKGGRGFKSTSRRNPEGKLEVRKTYCRNISRLFARSAPTQRSTSKRVEAGCSAINNNKESRGRPLLPDARLPDARLAAIFIWGISLLPDACDRRTEKGSVHLAARIQGHVPLLPDAGEEKGRGIWQQEF